MDSVDSAHLGHHLSTTTSGSTSGKRSAAAAQSTQERDTDHPLEDTPKARVTRSKHKKSGVETPAPALDVEQSAAGSSAAKDTSRKRKSARFSLPEPSGNDDIEHEDRADENIQPGVGVVTAGSRSKKAKSVEIASPQAPTASSSTDRKGKKRAPPAATLDSSLDVTRSSKRRKSVIASPRYSLRQKASSSPITPTSVAGPSASSSHRKQKAEPSGRSGGKNMPKKANPRQRRSGPSGTPPDRSRKTSSSKLQLDDPMDDDDESQWMEDHDVPGPYLGDDGDDQAEAQGSNMSGEGVDDEDDSEDDEEPSGALGGYEAGGSGFRGLASLAADAGGLQLDESTAAALFGEGFRSFGGLLSGLSNLFGGLKKKLRSPSAAERLAALRKCSELLLVSNEDTLGSSFSTNGFATEFIAILNGKPNIDGEAGDYGRKGAEDDMDEDAQLAAAIAMSTGGELPGGMSPEDLEAQTVANRCLANLMEALPGSGHTLVHLGAVPVLCSKLSEITYIELAEEVISTMEKISMEYPAAIVRENGLAALLNFLPFFNTTVQRTAVTTAANCCRNIGTEHYSKIRAVFPILRETLTQADQRLVEQATLAVVRTIESYRHSSEHLEGLLDLDTVVAINALLIPSGGSPLLSPPTYAHLLRALTSSARGSAKVAIAFLEAGMTNTVYHILTGVLPSTHAGDEQGQGADGQGLAGGIADMAVLQNLAHRPKDQVEEALALICELLPPTPRDGVFDSKGYSERSLAKIKKGRKPSERSATRRSSRLGETSGPATGATPESTAPTTPTGIPASPLPGSAATDATPTVPSSGVNEAVLKAKKEAEAQLEQRLELLRSQPELIGNFIKIVIPVLVDVYAASVASRVRTKVLTALTKAIAFAKQEDLYDTLKLVPMASFLCAIISSKDNPFFILSSLQLVELLANKLPEVYRVSFQREGVAYEIEALAAQELKKDKAAKDKSSEEDTIEVKIEPEGSPPAAGLSTASIVFPTSGVASGIPDGLRAHLGSGFGGSFTLGSEHRVHSASRKPSSYADPEDGNVMRARVLIAKKIFEGGDHKNAATAVLDELRKLVSRLCLPEASEGELREALRGVATHFTNEGEILSSFELLQSGLVDGLLDFVDISGTVPSSERRSMLYDIFSESSSPTSSPLAMLVKRLHESLGRLEDFEVETAFNGTADTSRSSSTLSRTMRVKLLAEEGEDIPKQVSALAVTIQAIAPLQALNDYLRPRMVDGNHMPGSHLSSMFAAYASGMPIPRAGGGSTSAASRILTALNAARGSTSFTIGEPSALGSIIPSSAPETSTRMALPPLTGMSSVPKPGEGSQRRRSARLSGQGLPDEMAPAPSGSGSTAAEAQTLSSSAPEPSVLPPMPMDLDFDEEGYSDEEYDAEVFEEDMEEDLSRPLDKVVNMSIAPDGLRVEAKTPDGTRVATPSQSQTFPPAGPSGSNTPRTASYAGAVKSQNNFHLEFYLDGKRVGLHETIYGLVHKMEKQKGDADRSGMLAGFGGTVTFRFRKVDGPAPLEAAPIDAPTPGSVVSAVPAGLDPTSPTVKILRLLRVVHNLFVDGREAAGRDTAHLDESLFVNNKLTAKLTRQLEEIMIIASGCLPDWSTELSKHFSFLFPFETRYSFLQSTSFGYGRLISRSQAAAQSRSTNNNSNRRDDISHLARLVRQKVRISRSQILESCSKVLELYGTSSGILEIEYFDEIGTGLGPTLEFFSIVSREFARRSLGIWRDEDESQPGMYVVHSKGLYPAPLGRHDLSESQQGSRLGWFKTLGIFAGRALLDSRIIDINLNKVFLKLILGKPVKKSIATLKLVDPTLARSLERLQGYLFARKEIEALQLLPGARRSKLALLTVGGAKLADLSLDFTLPGTTIELKPGGAHIDVDDHNLEEYLECVLEMILGSGVERQAKAFADGFSMVFPVSELKIFSLDELVLLFGNAEEDWSRETIEQSIKADHGYNLDSRAVQNLVQVMVDYSREERRQFLQFITGAPKLPIGGFRGLTPPFTVVRKPHEAPFRADDYLPSVMTCAQYLKLPDYSSKEILASQLQRAIHDGGGSFHLS